MQTMYPPQNNGIRTQLVAAINSVATAITVEDSAVLPAPPNILSLGGGDNTELVKMVAMTGNILTVERGFNGTIAKDWDEQTYIYRGIQAQDVSALQENVSTLDANKAWITHAQQHGENGDDPLLPSDIGAMKEDATPIPAAHAASHVSSGSDPVLRMWEKTLSADGWTDGSQDVSISVTSANAVFIAGVTKDDAKALSTADIDAIHITGGLRFTAANTPSVDIDLKISAI